MDGVGSFVLLGILLLLNSFRSCMPILLIIGVSSTSNNKRLLWSPACLHTLSYHNLYTLNIAIITTFSSHFSSSTPAWPLPSLDPPPPLLEVGKHIPRRLLHSMILDAEDLPSPCRT